MIEATVEFNILIDDDKAISRALDNTQRFARGLLFANTPKRTGRLAGAWQVNGGRSNLMLVNDTPYAKFVEDGTSRMRGVHYTKRSIPAIRARFTEEVINAYTSQ